MGLPVVGVAAAVGELAMNPKIQDFAVGLVKNVYGRIMPARGSGDEKSDLESPELTLEDIAVRIAVLPNRDELAAAFATLQADIDYQHQKTRHILVVGMGIMLVILLGAMVALSL